MSCQERVYQWTEIVHRQMPGLSKPQVRLLALWSFGIVLTQSCSLSAVTQCLALGLRQHPNTVRQRLREWCYDAAAKKGGHRVTLPVTACFAPLLRWVLAWSPGTQLALALDASSLEDRFVVLALSVVIRGCAVPVAWAVLPANKPKAWKPEWIKLLTAVQGVTPPSSTVIVLADRGLYARWLYQKIVSLGWHPFLRVNRGGTFRPDGSASLPMTAWCPKGFQWSGAGVAFRRADRRLACTLLIRWEIAHTDPWLILTDLAPTEADPAWYALRAWIEVSFKLTKRGGWQWQRTRMTDPDRAARLWLAMAVATLWVLAVGGEDDAQSMGDPSSVTDEPLLVLPHPRPTRSVGAARLGLWSILIALLSAAPLPVGSFRPAPWPTRRSLPTAPPPEPSRGKNLPL